jgi:hypothetical protein
MKLGVSAKLEACSLDLDRPGVNSCKTAGRLLLRHGRENTVVALGELRITAEAQPHLNRRLSTSSSFLPHNRAVESSQFTVTSTHNDPIGSQLDPEISSQR